MSIEVYTLEDKDGHPVCDGWSTQDKDEARQAAQDHKACLIANIYTFSDSELVDDYTGANNGPEIEEG